MGIPNIVGSDQRFSDSETRIGAGLDFWRTIQKFDFILFAGLPALRSRYFETQYRCAERARRFLLMPDQRPPNEYDSFLAASYFGFDELRIGRRDELIRPVITSWLPVATPMAPQEAVLDHRLARAQPSKSKSAGGLAAESAFARCRNCIWRAPHRNRRITSVANSLVRHEPTAATYSEIGQAAPRSWADRHVVVYVDTIEHAAALATRLSDWPIVCGDDINLRGISGGDARRLHARRGVAGGRCQIVTADGIHKIDWRDVDVVIRADAGVGGLPWLSDRLAAPEDSCRPLLNR